MPAPMAVAVTICATAPGSAMKRTDIRSLIEKCRPTPNISRITPISASWLASPESATKPGVNGPTQMPAMRYPTMGDTLRMLATKPNNNASTKPTASSAMSEVSCNSAGIRARVPEKSKIAALRGLECAPSI